jgi:hypothetical protein
LPASYVKVVNILVADMKPDPNPQHDEDVQNKYCQINGMHDE